MAAIEDLHRTHRVVACRGGRAAALETRTRPDPGAGELLLRMRLSGLCGTDLFKLTTGAAAPGTVLGHELVGEVEAVGAGTDGFAAGDRVVVPHHVPCGDCRLCRRGSETMCGVFRENLMEPGGFADHILIRRRAVEQAAFVVPDGVSDESAVFLEPAACVLRGIRRSGLGEDGMAVILGAGSMGLLHLLVLRAAHPGIDVIVVDPATERRETAARLGAAATAPGEEAKRAAQTLSHGLGADAVFDTVGGAGPLDAAVALSRQGGTVVLFAHAAVGAVPQIDLNTLFKYERRIVGTYSGALDEQREAFALIADGRLDASPLVTHRLPLDEFDAGVSLALERRALKVVFTPARNADG